MFVLCDIYPSSSFSVSSTSRNLFKLQLPLEHQPQCVRQPQPHRRRHVGLVRRRIAELPGLGLVLRFQLHGRNERYGRVSVDINLQGA